MSAKHQLQQSIYSLLKHNRDGSYETQNARRHVLFQAATELAKGGFKLHHVQGLKQKHVRYLNEHWQGNGISTATIKNRNAHLRWACEKLNKANLMPSNAELGIGRRRYVTPENKAVDLNTINLSKITNHHILVSVHLQRHFGLRREESIKIKPYQADKGNHIALQASWCKGGRARTVPILTAEARYWLEEAKKLVAKPTCALIPDNKTYIQHRHLYDKQTHRAGIKHAHGLRHAYAQDRYRELTGWKCPKCGGPTVKELTAEQKQIDREARLIISEHLGHGRIAIVKNYCG